MTEALFDRAEPIVAQALTFDEESRDLWVAEACAGDRALLGEVRALLGLAAAAPEFLTATALDDVARSHADDLSPAALVGRHVGPYRVDAWVGSGGMGDVYRVYHGALDRPEALKVFPRGGAAPDGTGVVAEARAASALNHPNVVTTYAVGEADGWHYIAMEFVEGETLRQRLTRGRVPPADAAGLALQLAAALVAAHRAGVVHRDLKPENVILTPDGRAKVVDFGIARRAADAGREGAAAGTGGYMAPEQAAGGEAGPAADQYAFGAIVREMLTGRHPAAAGANLEEVSAFGGEAQTLLRRCLAPAPSERFATTEELEHACQRWCTRLRKAGLTRRRLLQAASVAVAGAALWSVWPRRGTPRRIAVLPFRNVPGDAASAYLVKGLAASLIERLSAFPSLQVLPRSLMANFTESPETPLDVGRRLAAHLVLSGTVSASPTALLVTADLIDVTTGRSLFAMRHDEPAEALLVVEERLARAIVERSAGTWIGGAPERRVAHPGTDDAHAYDLYLRAVYHCEQETEEEYLAARTLLREALARDPGFGPGHVQMAATFVTMAVDGYERPTEAWAQSSRHVRQAIEANPDAADAFASAAAQEFFFTWDWDAAEAAWRRAMRFDGGDLHPDLHLARSLQRAALGRYDEALALAQTARRLDPVSPMFAVREADLFVYLGRLDDAIAGYEAVLEEAPGELRALFGLSDALRAQHRFDEALRARRRAHARLDDVAGLETGALADPALELTRLDRLGASAQLAALRSRAELGRYVSPLDTARQHARRGDHDAAARQFEAALADRAPGLTLLDVDRAWDGMRDDDRFRRLRTRVGLP